MCMVTLCPVVVTENGDLYRNLGDRVVTQDSALPVTQTPVTSKRLCTKICVVNMCTGFSLKQVTMVTGQLGYLCALSEDTLDLTIGTWTIYSSKYIHQTEIPQVEWAAIYFFIYCHLYSSWRDTMEHSPAICTRNRCTHHVQSVSNRSWPKPQLSYTQVYHKPTPAIMVSM